MSSALTVELPTDALSAVIAAQVHALLAERLTQTPWMNKAEAVEYSRLAEGTFAKLAADGTIPSHGGKTKVFHREEVDAALLRL